jgi:hypothetical protein
MEMGDTPYKNGLDAAYRDAQGGSFDWAENPFSEGSKEYDEWELGHHHGIKDCWNSMGW